MVEANSTEKLHAACDECRMRKLKCSGNHPTCSRCERENINCRYSPQKPMGRPRKRRREDGEVQSSEQVPQQQQQPSSTAPSAENFDSPNLNDLENSFGFGEMFGVEGFQSDTGFPMEFPAYSAAAVNNELGQDATPPEPDFNANSIDPSLWSMPNPNTSPQSNSTISDTGPCSCLSLTYLTITDLQAITDFTFPLIIPRLRTALNAASTILHCPKCPQQSFAAMQNVSSLTSLLTALAERYHRVLEHVETEAARADAASEKKSFRVGDSSPENLHLHTGALDCPMGFVVQLDPKDWKKLCKTALKTEVLGGGHFQMPLVKLLDEMEARQKKWHVDKSMESQERANMFGAPNGQCKDGSGGALCLRMAKSVRSMIGTMAWDD